MTKADQELLKKFDEYWEFFIDSHTSSGFSAENVSKFWYAMVPFGTSNTLITFWARDRFGIESSHALGRQLRDVAFEQANSQ